MILRKYQEEKRDEAIKIMSTLGIVLIAAEVRTGKTPISLSIAEKLKYPRVLFVTKKDAISSIENDYRSLGYKFHLKVINYEQLHNIDNNYDLVILDEVHSCGQVPKPSKRTKQIKNLFYEKPMILLSGTPSPETYSQLYHEFWMSIYSPWHEYTNFYKWAHKYVDKRQKLINGFMINDYTRGREELIMADIKPYMVNLSQVQAGFTQLVQERFLKVAIDRNLYDLMDYLKKNRVYKMKNGSVIMADTPVRLMSCYHQICSGTIKTEDEQRHFLDTSKADFIKQHFKGKKIAIIYMYVAEGMMLKKIFPNHTDNSDKFNKNDNLVYIRQVRSAREGVNLSTADALVMYNIDYSATSYFQIRARIQTKTRTKDALLYWIFSDKGIESRIYGVVKNKKKFTTYYFKKEYGS